MKKNFFWILTILFFSHVSVFSQSISDRMYRLLLSKKFSPITQSLVSSGENAFNYNIIVDFLSNNQTDKNKLPNLILIFNQEDFFAHDYSDVNSQMILDTLSELQNQTLDFNLIFLFTVGERQYPEKRDMIFGSQVFLESLNSNEDFTVYFFNLNENETKILSSSKGTISPSWMIQNAFNIFIKNGFSNCVPSFYLSQLFKLKVFENKLLNPFFENNIPAIQINFNTHDFIKENQNVQTDLNISDHHEDTRSQIILQIIEKFAETPSAQRIWEHHFLMIKLFGRVFNLSEKTTVKIIIIIVFLWLFFLLFFVFINEAKKKYDWQQIKKIWYVVPLTFFVILFSFWAGRALFLSAANSFDEFSKVFTLICTQFLLTFILLSIIYDVLLIVNPFFEEHSIDFLITFCCFINQSLFILIDISLFPIFMFICFLSILAIIIKNNILHISIFLLMTVSFLPYFDMIVNHADILLLRQFYFTNNHVLLFFTLILYPIFIVYFRILTSFKRKTKKISVQIIITGVISFSVAVLTITTCFIKDKSLQKTTRQKNEYVIKASTKDSVIFNYSDKKVFDDIIRTIDVEFSKAPLQVDISIECQNETPILYSDNDFVRTSSNTAHFKIPYMPPQKMTFSYCCEKQPSKLIITAIFPTDEPSLLSLISKTIEIESSIKSGEMNARK